MAAVQQQLRAQSRGGGGGTTRSTRVDANTARPLQQPPASSAHSVQAPPSSLTLFISNLKLLDLDLLPDWPGLSVDTFAATGAGAPGQKRRVQAVEWALFQLFALWDPEETANKLKPFFPPLDQVQSINLRAAFLRALEQAKKNGVLGRDAVLRKTMLDECKGERLEEVLAAFSTAVLKRVVADDTAANGDHPALALTMALSQAVDHRTAKDDRIVISALILAHKVSLRRLRERRAEMDARYRDFSDLLGVKERSLVRKKEEARARQQSRSSSAITVSDDAKLEMRRTVRNNWTGNEQWMETLLYGDAAVHGDGTFGMPFDRVWRRVEQDRLSELEARDTGLLEQLEGRTRLHKDRLDKWRAYRTTIFGEGSRANMSPSKQKQPAKRTKGIDLGFGAHEQLHIGSMSPSKQSTSLNARLTKEYRHLLHEFSSELSGSNDKHSGTMEFLRSKQKSLDNGLRPPSAIDEPISEISDLEEDSLESYPSEAPIKSFQTKLDDTKLDSTSPAMEDHDLEFEGAFMASASPVTRISPTRQPLNRQSSTDTYTQQSTRASPSRKKPAQPQSPSQSRYSGDNDTQELADQILDDMESASPSPSKRSKPRHTLSLAERTRLSMAPRGSSIFLDGDEPELEHTLSSASAVPKEMNSDDAPEAEAAEDLASRTRRSMAGFEKARQKAQLERRRSQRRSKLPPQRKESSYFGKVDEEEQSMLAEELLAEEDMEAVFRSRPKIKASPLPSPTREFESDGEGYMG